MVVTREVVLDNVLPTIVRRDDAPPRKRAAAREVGLSLASPTAWLSAVSVVHGMGGP